MLQGWTLKTSEVKEAIPKGHRQSRSVCGNEGVCRVGSDCSWGEKSETVKTLDRADGGTSLNILKTPRK